MSFRIRFGLLTLLSISFSIAHSSAASESNLTWVAGASAGSLWAEAGQTQTIQLTPEIEKTYVDAESTQVIPSGEFFFGMQKSLSKQCRGQLGLAVTINDNLNIEGVIWDDTNPQFANENYQYDVQNNRLALKGKLLFDTAYYGVSPWVSVSLGLGFNRAHDYTNTPLIFEAIPNKNFADHTEAAFSYSLGLGLQKTINQHWAVGIGYEFSDWGKNGLGSAPEQTLNSGPSMDHIYTNGLLFAIFYSA